ncbi:MAG: hypothetical protein IJ329_02900 [Clostridia bacterium]|nr:hypothetical protein [Clostridia bacterium]
MLDYTKAAIRKTVDDFKRVDYVRNVVTQVLYILYLGYACYVPIGVFWANVALLALSVSYFVFFMIMTGGQPLRPPKKTQKFVAILFKRSKQLLKLYTLGVTVYGIYSTTKAVTPIGVVLSALMIVGWLLQIIFEVLIRIFTSRAQLIIEGLEADYENLVKPVKSVGNFFKKITGKEVEQPKEKSKTRVWLDKKVEENRAEKEAQKRAVKAQRKQAKKDAKNTVFLSPAEEVPILPESPQAEEVFEEPPLLTGGTDVLTEKKTSPKIKSKK